MQSAKNFFGKERVTLYHGSPQIVRRPQLGRGNPHNDYGPGFYTTELQELACEWACPQTRNGWANEYKLDTKGLLVLDLSGDEFTVLNWMAILLSNRKIAVNVGIAQEARAFLIDRYGISLKGADIVHGYRADDSYFHIARAFLNNRIPVEVLEQALFLGGLGYQVALMSERAFENLEWMSAEPASGAIWNPRRMRRDSEARAVAAKLEHDALANHEGTYVLDFMRSDGAWQQ